jgi:tetratricopeptide (TPR) repeat protein
MLWALRLFIALGCLLSVGHAQSESSYDSLIHQGKAQLQAGNNDVALTTANTAIKLNEDRWEAYALAGGALMNLKRYEEAADDFSKGIERAPEAKQAGLRDLRKQCLLAEAGATPSSVSAASPATTQPAVTTTPAEIVLWKSIENSTNAADFQSYLDRYPNGAFAVLAQRHLADAKAQAEKAQQIVIQRTEQAQEAEVARSTWTDPTGLMWAKRADGPHLAWDFAQATDYCAKKTLGQYSDWRLPSMEEAMELDGLKRTEWDELERISECGLCAMATKGMWSRSPGKNDGEHMMFRYGRKFSAKDSSNEGMVLCVRDSKSATIQHQGEQSK